MKRPKWAAMTLQEIHNLGLNPFAVQLLAESFADKPEKFGDENLVVCGHAHNGQEVWLVLSKTAPRAEDFEQ